MSLKEKIKKLIKVIKDTDIDEIEVSSFWGAQKIRLSKNVAPSQQVSQSKTSTSTQEVSVPVVNEKQVKEEPAPLQPIVEETVDIKEDTVDPNLIYQNAPLVGTFYISSKPGEPPFVEVGQKVAKGQTLCIIEAMKIFNEIESDHDGEIVEILINDSSPVEFNQPIFSIRNT